MKKNFEQTCFRRQTKNDVMKMIRE